MVQTAFISCFRYGFGRRLKVDKMSAIKKRRFYNLRFVSGLQLAVFTVQEASQAVAAGRVAQLAECFCLNLADSFAGYVKLFANFFKCMVGIHVDAETHT